MVPVAGLEPARYRYQWILSPSRLPIPSHRQFNFIIILPVKEKIKYFFVAFCTKAHWVEHFWELCIDFACLRLPLVCKPVKMLQ